MAELELLDGELRHRCTCCVGGCTDLTVPGSPEERATVEALAPELEVERPVVDESRVRFDLGACVFRRDEDALCALHCAAGPESKPHTCRQYPVVATRTRSGVRVGIDPGCYAAILSWRDGPVVPDQPLVVADKRHDSPELAAMEAGLLRLVEHPGASVAGLLEQLTGTRAPRPGQLPEGLGSRIVTRLQAMQLPEMLAQPQVGAGLRSSLGPLAEALKTWDPASPPAWGGLGPDQEAWAVEVLRRMVWLRLGSTLPLPARALLVLVGAVAGGWVTTDHAQYGELLAGWVRALRAPDFWRRLTPDSQALAWLARG